MALVENNCNVPFEHKNKFFIVIILSFGYGKAFNAANVLPLPAFGSHVLSLAVLIGSPGDLSLSLEME